MSRVSVDDNGKGKNLSEVVLKVPCFIEIWVDRYG